MSTLGLCAIISLVLLQGDSKAEHQYYECYMNKVSKIHIIWLFTYFFVPSPHKPHIFNSIYSDISSKHQAFQRQRKECSEEVINKITAREELTAEEKRGVWSM